MSELASTYTVKRGDNLTRIANETKTSPQELAKANHIKNPQLIKPGQVLVVPRPGSPIEEVPHVELQFLDKLGNAIVGMTCFITHCGNETIHKTDANGNIPTFKANKPGEEIKIAVKRIEGGKKHVGSVHSSSQPKFVQVQSPAVKFEVATQQHQGTPGNATPNRPKVTGPVSGAPVVNVARSEAGHPVAVVVGGSPLEKSGVQWCKKFLQSDDVADLRQPFRDQFESFYDALTAAGIDVDINTTYRPPQRSYLMYYAAEIRNGKLSPDKVPPFVPQKGDEAVHIDWAHRGADGKADLEAARAAAKNMYDTYGATGAIGKPYSSNHNIGGAVDMDLSPVWGIGKSVKAAGAKDGVEIKSKKDLMAIGATYGVFHWNYHGRKRTRNDEVHWSRTGN